MLNFLIAPDFPPENFSGWHIFNTLLQRKTKHTIHLQTPADHTEEAEILARGKADVIYANPFDAAELIRKQNYLPLVRPINKPDEMVIATYAQSPFNHSDDLSENCRILVTHNRDVRLIGLRLLESASLAENHVEWLPVPTFQAAARRLIAREADAAFFLASAYHNLNASTRRQMRVLMESRLNDLTHVVLLHPDHAAERENLLYAFTDMSHEAAGRLVLEDLGLPEGFMPLDQEAAEFMIDLMDTLLD